MGCTHLFHNAVDAGQIRGRDTGKKMVQRQHGVSFTPAKICLQLDDRIAA